MPVLSVLAVGAVAVVVFTVPGALLLARWRSSGFFAASGSLALDAAAAFLFSSLSVAAAAWCLAALPPPLGRVMARGGALVLAVAAVLLVRSAGLWRIRERLAPHLPVISLIAGLFILWSALLPRSPYPSQLSVSLGDTVGYYRVAANIAAGRGLVVDYFTGDYTGGKAAYATGQPLLSLVGAALFLVVGVNMVAIHLYDILAATLLVGLWSSLVTSPLAGRGWRPGWIEAAAGAVFALVPKQFLSWGLGGHTVPGALAFLLLVAPTARAAIPPSERKAYAAIAVAYLATIRPEAALAALAWLAATVGRRALAGVRERGDRRAWIAAGALAALVVAAWVFLPALLPHLPASLQNMTFNYVYYDRDQDVFAPRQRSWFMLNQELCRVNLQPRPDEPPLANPALGEQIRGHRVAFARFILSGTAQVGGVLQNPLLNPGKPPPRVSTTWGLFVLLLVLAPTLVWRPARILGATIVLFLLALPLFNGAMNFRHLLVFWPALTAVAGAGLLSAASGRLPSNVPAGAARAIVLLGCVAVVLAGAVDARLLARVRSTPANLSYVPILEDLGQLAAPGSVIATSYPALIAFMTDRRAVGCTWLTENLEGLVAKFRPDLIVIDNAREGPDNYQEYIKRPPQGLAEYTVAVHRPGLRYAILRRKHQEAAP